MLSCFRTELCSNPIRNVYVSPSLHSVLHWHGVVFPQMGYFAGGIFRFSMLFDEQEPDKLPCVRFETDMYHPLVDASTREVDLRVHLEKKKGKVHIVEMVQCLRDLLIDDIKHWHHSLFVFNRDCFQSYMHYLAHKNEHEREHEHAFLRRMKQCVAASVANKDRDVDAQANPISFAEPKLDKLKQRGHAQLIKQNLKTFKVRSLCLCLDWLTHSCTGLQGHRPVAREHAALRLVSVHTVSSHI